MSKHLVIIGIVSILLLALSVVVYLLIGGYFKSNDVKVGQGQIVASAGADDQQVPEQTLTNSIQKSLKKTTGESLNFNMINSEVVDSIWVIVTCTVENTADGSVKFVLKKTNDATNPYTVVFNPLSMPDPIKNQLPQNVQDKMRQE